MSAKKSPNSAKTTELPKFQPDGFMYVDKLIESTESVSTYMHCATDREIEYLWVLRALEQDLNTFRAICPKTATRLLQAASFQGHIDIVCLLVRNFQIEVWTQNNVALRQAVEGGCLEMVKFLLSNPKVDATAHNNECIKKAMEKHNCQIVLTLIQHPVALDGVLEWAVDNNHVEIISALLTKQDPSVDDNRAVRIAAALGYDKAVEVLLGDPRVDITDCDHYAVKHATVCGRIDVLKLIHGVVPTPIKLKSLKLATKYHQANSVEFWLGNLGPIANQELYSSFKHRLAPQIDKLWKDHLVSK